MRMVDLIHQKQLGQQLSKAEIDYVVVGFTQGIIPDYQMSALLMAIFFRGMEVSEIADLTMAMAVSGDQMDLSEIKGIKVDKHSTGGVGDKLSLILAPLVASVGVPVAKMSGRGLGHTGGTMDKLESFPGFQVELTNEQFIRNVNEMKLAIVGQSGNLAPADKKIYALRDVTATVASIPLIASSIMSKKIASGADCIVLDVKVGTGAFMKTLPEARELAQTMVNIGTHLKRKTIALITDMNQPLGHEVGNINEIKEIIEVLQGGGPEDLRLLSLTLASYMVVLGGAYEDYAQAYKSLEKILATGVALNTFKQFIAAQGGDAELIDHPDRFVEVKYSMEVKASKSGYISEINAEAVGTAAMLLGAGREKKDDIIDYAAGVRILHKIGEYVEVGEPLFIIRSNREDTLKSQNLLLQSVSIQDMKPPASKWIYEVIE